MKKWIAGLLTLVMLSHALPWTIFADAVAAGKMITESELTRALQIAGLQPVSHGAFASEEGDLPYRLEAKQNKYHEGMTPNETWDAGMLRAWLNDKLSKDLYHVTDVFTRADSRLQRMKSDDPAAYTRLTTNAEYSGFAEECHNAMLTAVDIEEKHRFLNHSIMQDVTLIENNAERLADLEDRLYDSEKARISAQIREATNHLADLRSQVMALQEQEMKGVRQLQGVILGDSKPAFSDWLHEVLSSGEYVQRSTVSADTIQVVDAYTRMSRMTSGRRVLSNDDSQDATVKVIKKDQFAFEMHGVDNQPVSGVNVTVKDLNGKTVETKTTDELGSVVFDACNYVNDFDFTMEMSLDVKASGVGYRDFYIPWTIISQGQVIHETLVLLTGPETRENKANGTREEKEARAIAIAKEGEVKPYISTCMFNGLDIMKRDLTIWISPLNDADLDFTIEVTHEENKEGDPPWLHFQYYDIKTDRSGWTEMQPSRKEVVNAQKTRYVYTKKWKQYLRPDILDEDRPYFVIPSTKEKVQTNLAPVRSLVDQPITTGQEASNPFTTVFSKAFGFNFALPEGMGILGLSLPFEKNLPKINSLPNGYVTVAWGSSMVNPEEPAWQTDESNKYDKAMKHYAHEKSLAKKKQAMGTAYDYYHGLRDIKCQSRLDLDVGFFVMGTGRCQTMEDGTSLWGFSAMFGTTMTLNFDTTFMVTIAYIPLYLNINIGGCFGIGIDLFHVTWNTDKNGRPINARFEPFNNLTINLRLSAGFTVGVGIKGIVSVWFGGSFILNLIVSVNVSAPDRAQVYIEGSLSVGFELFWIKYSKVVFDIGRRKVHDDTFNAQPSNDQPQYTLFDAYAEANDEPEQAEILSHEPEHYPALVPEAWLATVMDPGQNVKIVRYKDYDFCFGNIWFQDGPAKIGKLRIRNLTTGYSLTTDYYLEDFFRENKLYLSNYSVYGHDAYSDGDRLHVVLTLAKSFDDQHKPIPGGNKDKPNIVVVYMEFEGIEPERASGNMPIFKRALMYRWIVDVNNAITPACSNPRIAGVRKMGGQPVVIGSLDGQTEDGNSSQFNTFCIEPERADDPNSPIFAVYGDMTVGHIESGNTRVAMFPSIRIWREGSQRKEAHSINEWDWELPSMGFIALERSKYGEQYLTYFDYSQNWDLGEVKWKDVIHRLKLTAVNQRDPLFLNMETYNDIEVVQSIGGNVDPTMSVFYTHLVTTKEGREGYQLIGIYMSPRTFTDQLCHDVDYDMVYSDFDVLLPVPDFDTATIGVSQYLYWLTTAPREKDTDPYVWRIDGMYYDRDTNSLSDELAIAEFMLPKISYGGGSYDAVPQQITLTDSGVGYITAAPDLGKEQSDALPLTLYSFPITLKPHMTMKKAALTETTVVQGDFVHTDFSMMNDGNMGIANFELEVRHLRDAWERECVETLYGDLLVPDNSKLVMHGDRDEVVATGEHALYRNKDFIYSPKRHDWLVQTEEHNVHISGSIQKDSIGDGASDHVVTNVLVPGVLGGFAGAIKIPNDWTGKHDLRLKLTKYSTYSNWLAASRLAQTNPELFTDLESNSATAQSNREKLAARGIVRLDYALDEASGKMVLQNAAEVLANGGDTPVNLFAQEVTASNDIDIDCEVHDLQVDYRLWNDYYGDEMLDIVLHDYYQDNGTMELTCAMYLDNSATPVYVSIPYDPKALSSDKTTTISLPLSTLFDPSVHRSARFVFTPRGVAETANVNNEFTIYTGGSSDLYFTKQPEDATVQEGGNVSFEVEVAGGMKPYSYQWQVWDEKHQKWVDIRGFNGSTLSRKDIEKKWDGCKFRCVVTDAEGTQIISRVVTLTVRGIVPTGDHSNLPLYLAIAFVALALLALLRRRAKNI